MKVWLYKACKAKTYNEGMFNVVELHIEKNQM